MPEAPDPVFLCPKCYTRFKNDAKCGMCGADLVAAANAKKLTVYSPKKDTVRPAKTSEVEFYLDVAEAPGAFQKAHPPRPREED